MRPAPASLCFHKCSLENHHTAMTRACWSLQPQAPQGSLCSADFHGLGTLLVLIHLSAHGFIGKVSFHTPSSGFYQEKSVDKTVVSVRGRRGHSCRVDRVPTPECRTASIPEEIERVSNLLSMSVAGCLRIHGLNFKCIGWTG